MVSGVMGALVALGMVLILPQGLRLMGGRRLVVLAKLWPLAVGAPGALSLTLRPGIAAGLLALVFALGCLALVVAWALHLVDALREGEARAPQEIIRAAALLSPAFAAWALWNERSGRAWAGLSGQDLTVFTAHALFAGFATAIVAGLLLRSRETQGGPALTAAMLLPLGGIASIAGLLLRKGGAERAGAWVEFGGSTVFTLGMFFVSAVLLLSVVRRTRRRAAQVLLAVAAVTPAVSMGFVLVRVLGLALGREWVSQTTTMLAHGLSAALGFALCALLGWTFYKADPSKARRLRRRRRPRRFTVDQEDREAA